MTILRDENKGPVPGFDELVVDETSRDDGWWDSVLNDPEYVEAPLANDGDLLRQLIDWRTFWERDGETADWLCEPLIAAGRAHAIFAPGGTGKSLLSLWLAVTVATGRQGLQGWPVTARKVLYIDYEMTEDDLRERLEAMGYGPETDLTNLSYMLLPALPPADTAEGGKNIARAAELCDAALVIIDTFSRAVEGDENDADTVRAFYRWTGIHLKAAGRAFARIDHAGKDIDKGQRGSSAKNDDVDVVWRMKKTDSGAFAMHATKRRMGWVPEDVTVIQFDEPHLHYKVVDDVAPVGTERVMRELDRLQVPPTLSARAASAVLRDAKISARNDLIRAAQKARKRDATGVAGIRKMTGGDPLDER